MWTRKCVSHVVKSTGIERESKGNSFLCKTYLSFDVFRRKFSFAAYSKFHSLPVFRFSFGRQASPTGQRWMVTIYHFIVRCTPFIRYDDGKSAINLDASFLYYARSFGVCGFNSRNNTPPQYVRFYERILFVRNESFCFPNLGSCLLTNNNISLFLISND